jgi:hypothetical protein
LVITQLPTSGAKVFGSRPAASLANETRVVFPAGAFEDCDANEAGNAAERPTTATTRNGVCMTMDSAEASSLDHE